MTLAPSYRPDSYVRSWIMTLPGYFEGPTPDAAIRKAHFASGLSGQMAVAVFAECLARMGHTPICVRNGCYRLRLPEGGRHVV